MFNTHLLQLEGNIPFPCVCRTAIAIKPISSGNSNINLPIGKKKKQNTPCLSAGTLSYIHENLGLNIR